MRKLWIVLALLLSATCAFATGNPSTARNDGGVVTSLVVQNFVNGGGTAGTSGTLTTYAPWDGPNNCLVVGLAFDANVTIAGGAVTWDGVPMNLAGTAVGTNPKLYIYTLDSPNVGQKTLSVAWTTSARWSFQAVTIRNIAASTCDTPAANYTSRTVSSAGPATFTGSITSNSGDAVVSFATVNFDSISSGNQTQFAQISATTHVRMAGAFSTSGTINPSYNLTGGADQWAIAALNLPQQTTSTTFSAPCNDNLIIDPSYSGAVTGDAMTSAKIAASVFGANLIPTLFTYPATDVSPHASYLSFEGPTAAGPNVDASMSWSGKPSCNWGNPYPGQKAVASQLGIDDYHQDATNASTIAYQNANPALVRGVVVIWSLFKETFPGSASTPGNRDLISAYGTSGAHLQTGPSITDAGPSVSAGTEITIGGACMNPGFVSTGNIAQSGKYLYMIQYSNDQTVSQSIRFAVYTRSGHAWSLVGSHDEAAVGGNCSADLWNLLYFGGIDNKNSAGATNNQHILGGGYGLCWRNTEAACSFDPNAYLSDPVSLETAADGSGTAPTTATATVNVPYTVYPLTRDLDDNTFISNVASTCGLVASTGGITSGMLVTAGDGKSVTLTATVTGTATIMCYDAYNIPSQNIVVTVNASSGSGAPSGLSLLGAGKK